MGLEVSSYISGLTPSWPVSGDPKNQGDDHIRLLKGVLQGTFPNATKPIYFPAALGLTTNQVLNTGHQNCEFLCSTAAGAYTITLPTLTAADAGWRTSVMKYSLDANFVNVVPAAGVINSQAGGTALIRVGQVGKTATFTWSGSAWFCTKDGGLIGETVNFDGNGLPPGYITLDGSAFDPTAFCELYAMLGTNVLRDKRGRVDAGVDNGATGRLANGFGASGNGAVGGLDYHYQTVNEMPAHRHVAGIYDPTHAHGVNQIPYWTTNNGVGVGGGGVFGAAGTTSISIQAAATGVRVNSDGGLDTTYAVGGGAFFTVVQPTIVTQKIVRAC